MSAFPPGGLAWILGIEDTSVYPPEHYDMAQLDEHDLTGHNEHWREDLVAARSLGATAIRYGVTWPRVHLAPGRFDWSELDERLRFASDDLGLTVIADFVHYGTPTWLSESFADPRYPDAIAEFSAAFVDRYRGLVEHVTPLNEPLTTASFCGLRGVWPPALTGWAGWVRVTLGIVDGIRRTIEAARAANPEAVIVHVEASSLYLPAQPDLAEHAALLAAVAVLPTELLLGLVDDEHPMYEWLLQHGADAGRLASFQSAIPAIDFLGVNYYPDLTPRRLIRLGDSVEQVTTNRWADGLRACLRYFADRFDVPILLTETSIEGDEALRTDWLAASVESIRDLREDGLDIRGYTWWPLIDFVDWSYASGGRNVEEFVLDRTATDGATVPHAEQYFADASAGRATFFRRMGLLTLTEAPDGSLGRSTTAAARLFVALAAGQPEIAQ